MSVANQFCSIGRADEADVDTLELELTEDEMMALTRAAALRHEGATSPIDPPPPFTLLSSVSHRPVPTTGAIAEIHFLQVDPHPLF